MEDTDSTESEEEEEATARDPCTCCKPFHASNFTLVDNPSYFKKSYVDSRPYQPKLCVGCDRAFTLDINLEKKEPKKYYCLKRDGRKGPKRQSWFCLVANDAHTDDCMAALCDPCYNTLNLNNQVEKVDNRSKVYPDLPEETANEGSPKN